MRRALARIALYGRGSRMHACGADKLSSCGERASVLSALGRSRGFDTLLPHNTFLGSYGGHRSFWGRSLSNNSEKGEEKAGPPPPPDAEEPSTPGDSTKEGTSGSENVADAGTEGGADESSAAQEVSEELKEAMEKISDLETKAKEDKEAMLRLLADMENLRTRTAKQIDDTKKFAVQALAKELLEVADNMERALGHVPEEAVSKAGPSEGADYYKQLCTFAEGIGMVNGTLQRILSKNGLERYDPMGQRFDPNTMNAMFENPDPSKKNKEVFFVAKVGYTLNGRVIRAADVGVATGGEEWPEEEVEESESNTEK